MTEVGQDRRSSPYGKVLPLYVNGLSHTTLKEDYNSQVSKHFAVNEFKLRMKKENLINF